MIYYYRCLRALITIEICEQFIREDFPKEVPSCFYYYQPSIEPKQWLIFAEGLFLRIWSVYFISAIFQPDWIELSITCFRYGWFNDGWHCFGSIKSVEGMRWFAPACLVIFIQIIMGAKNFSWTRVLRIKHRLLIIGVPYHKIVTLPIELEKKLFSILDTIIVTYK